MPTILIPNEWKEAVCTILQAEDPSKIQITQRAQNDFSSQFPNAWRFDLYDLLKRYLLQPNAQGRLITGLTPPGITYDFICEYNAEKVYAKINLLNSGDVILIVSAHRPLKGDTL